MSLAAERGGATVAQAMLMFFFFLFPHPVMPIRVTVSRPTEIRFLGIWVNLPLFFNRWLFIFI